MGLDATVYCNCVERGLLRVPHPYPDLLHIDEDGYQGIISKDLTQQMEHDQWRYGSPCAHEDMHAYSAWLGNVSAIAFLRDIFTAISKRPSAPALPVLLDKVLYNGTHAGDYLTSEQVLALQEELRDLKQFDFKPAQFSSDDEAHVDRFFTELELLIDASLAMHKPISF